MRIKQFKALCAVFTTLLVLTAILAPTDLSLASTAAFNFNIILSSYLSSVEQGRGAYFSVTVGLVSGSGRVTLTLDPSIGRWGFIPGVVTPTERASLSIDTSALSPGTYRFRVKGEKVIVAGEPPIIRYSDYVTLTVNPPRPVEPFDFSLTASILSRRIEAGQSTYYDITARLVSGRAQRLDLTVSGLPTSARGYFVPSWGSPTFTSKLYVETTSSTPAGTYELRVKATTQVLLAPGPGPIDRTQAVISLQLTVTAPARPPDFDFTLSSDPTTRTVEPGQTTSYSISINLVAGTRRDLSIDVEGLPYHAISEFPSVWPVTREGRTLVPYFTLRVTLPGDVRPGVYTITVKGTYTPLVGSPITRSVRVLLTVRQPENFDFWLRVIPNTFTIGEPGYSAEYSVTVDTLSSRREYVELSVSSRLPGGVTCSFSTTRGIGDFTSTLRITTSRDTPTGDHTFVVTGRGERGLTREERITLAILATRGLIGITLTVRGTVWTYGSSQEEWIPIDGVSVVAGGAATKTSDQGAYELTFGYPGSEPPDLTVAVYLKHKDGYFSITGPWAGSLISGPTGLWFLSVARGITLDPSRRMLGPGGLVTSVPWTRQDSSRYSAQADFLLGEDLARVTDALVEIGWHPPCTVTFAQGLYQELPANVKGEILRDLGYIYYWSNLAYNYHRALIGPPTSTGFPIYFHSTTPKVFWQAEYSLGDIDRVWINIHTSQSRWDNLNAPKNREWHELGHHLTMQLYGTDCTSIWERPGVNHAGYTNPSSQDSLIEGLAEFISMMTASYLRQPRGVDPQIYVGANLELNYVPTTIEEYAVASLLWDLFDDTPSEPFTITSTDPSVGVIRDGVSLSDRDILLTVIRDHKRLTVTGLYESFVQEFPGQRQGITRLFIGHGFFEDRNNNGIHDAGEPVGSTWDPARSFDGRGGFTHSRWAKPPIDRSFILTSFKGPGGEEVANGTLHVAITFDPPYDYFNYQYKIGNVRSGQLVYFTMPPEGYPAKANITATAPRYLASKPLWIKNEFYWKSLAEAKGEYFLEHTFELQKPSLPGKACLIATATYGSELSPIVQSLRSFRDEAVLSTFAGKQFMAAFNAWYYSFSPALAQTISSSLGLQSAVKVALYPLMVILQASASAYAFLGFTPELAIVISGLLATGFIGIVYLAPWMAIALLALRRRRDTAFRASHLKPLAVLWLGSVAFLGLAEFLQAPLAMTVASATFALANLTTAAYATSAAAVHRASSQRMDSSRNDS